MRAWRVRKQMAAARELARSMDVPPGNQKGPS
jgi:hypothetical protein